MSEPIVYHTGFLAVDRAADEGLHKRAAKLAELAEQGQATLAQRRLGVGQYEYLAKVKT